MIGAREPQDQYIIARRVLLDALEALSAHLNAITLVGAQAIYLRVGDGSDFGVSPYTTDADLTLNPTALGPEPELIQTMQAAGFERQGQPGIWRSAKDGLTVDLLVPEKLGGAGRRAARLDGHGANAAHKVTGLDGALVDYSGKPVSSLEPSDTRRYHVRVAGPMALIIAKLYKIWDRRGTLSREDAKDALDLYRILRRFLRRFSTDSLARRFATLRRTEVSHDEAVQALTYLDALFHDETADGPRLIAQALGRLADPAEHTASSVILARDLLAAITPRRS